MQRWWTALLLVAPLLAGCADGGTAPGELLWGPTACELPAELPEAQYPVAVFNTSHGEIRADLFLEMVPLTVQNFIDLAESGSYDETLFHRIITDFMMQGGDTASQGKSLEEGPFGFGGAAANGGSIPDEFHRSLRHDQPGRLSMANSGPNTGGSQFFITFTPTPHLDDKHSVFGQVWNEDLGVLGVVEEAAASASGTPEEEVRLLDLTIEYPNRPPISSPALRVFTYDSDHPAEQGTTSQFIAVVANDSDRRLPVCLVMEDEGEAHGAVEAELVNTVLPAGQTQAFLVDVALDHEGGGGVRVIAKTIDHQSEPLTLTLSPVDLGGKVLPGDEVVAHYIGMTVDGRLFDSSMTGVVQGACERGMGYATLNCQKQGQAFSFTPGSGVIQGFTDLAVGTAEKGIAAGRIAPEDAYGKSGNHPLAGRTLIFQLEIVAIS